MSRAIYRPFVVGLALLGMAGSSFAQRLEFEVASVKRNVADGPSDSRGPRRSGTLIAMHNVQPFSVIFYAYNLSGSYQIAGYTPLPDGWNWYDIDAVADASVTEEQLRSMFRSLLEDRFKLRVHRETKELSEYELVIGKKAKLTPTREGTKTLTIEGRTFSARDGTCGTTLWKEGNHIVCHAVGVDKIVAEISNLLKAPIVDRTSLTGKYDLNVLYLPDNRKIEPDAPAVPSLEDAIEEELGLKIQKGKGPIEILIVDHWEKPSEN